MRRQILATPAVHPCTTSHHASQPASSETPHYQSTKLQCYLPLSAASSSAWETAACLRAALQCAQQHVMWILSHLQPWCPFPSSCPSCKSKQKTTMTHTCYDFAFHLRHPQKHPTAEFAKGDAGSGRLFTFACCLPSQHAYAACTNASQVHLPA